MTHEPFTGFLQGNITAQRQQRPAPTELHTHGPIAQLKEEDRPSMYAEGDPVNPDHYRGFSNGAEVIEITENLTFNAGSAVKYLARAGRIDGQNKGQIEEDLRKALWYTRRELSRLQGASDE